MEASKSRAFVLLFYALVSQFSCCLCCHDMTNSASGSAGCVSFGNNQQNQCSDLDCPEVHVETCSNPCMMTTQSFTVPKSCCNGPCGNGPCCNGPCGNGPCCSAPYCRIPAPQPVCSIPPPPPPPPVYSTTTCFTTPCPKSPRPPPPRPMPQMMSAACCCPYQYSPQMAAPAPSYCVQSVVVGGKSEGKKDEDKGDEEGKGREKPEEDNNVGRGRPGSGSPDGDLPTGSARPGGRGPGGGLFVDPVRFGGGLGGGYLGGLAGIPGLLAGFGRYRFPFPGLCGEEDSKKRYENYLEKILDVIKDKHEPDCVGPSPIMVMQDCCTPRVKVRKIRRRRKQRKYMLESVEVPDDEIVEEEEEESPCSCVFASPCGCRSSRRRRCRHFL